MKCEVCRKREATVAYTYIVDNEQQMLQLCSVCVAAQKGAESVATQQVSKIVAKPKIEPQSVDQKELAPCPRCGMTYEAFRKGGRFGCHGCYEAFAAQLAWLMKQIHGAVGHCGKPRVERRERVDPEEELGRLRQQLQNAVVVEAYEKAAELRDRIRTLEGLAKIAPVAEKAVER